MVTLAPLASWLRYPLTRRHAWRFARTRQAHTRYRLACRTVLPRSGWSITTTAPVGADGAHSRGGVGVGRTPRGTGHPHAARPEGRGLHRARLGDRVPPWCGRGPGGPAG